MKGQTNSFVLNNKLQRTLRRNLTDAEQLLWKRLRGRQLNGYKFRRQLHLAISFLISFVLKQDLSLKSTVGNTWTQNLIGFVMRRLFKSGFQVMRFWNNQVLNELDSVVETIWNALEPHPHPSLPLEGEGTGGGS